MTKETKDSKRSWYPNFYTSKHIYNNKCFFLDFWPKSYKYETTKEEIIRSEKVGSICYLICNRLQILNNITYILRYNYGLIWLSQIQELGIMCYNHLEQIILKQRGNTIKLISRYKNFFILNTPKEVLKKL